MLFLAKLNVSVTVALFLFYFFSLPGPPPLDFSTFVFFFLLFVCVSVYVCVEGRDSQTLHWWLFSWFIIINHCNDSFIQLVVTCLWENLWPPFWPMSTRLSALERKDGGHVQGGQTASAVEMCTCEESCWVSYNLLIQTTLRDFLGMGQEAH